MKLTRAGAIGGSVELWTWLAEDGGREKKDWPGWKYHGKVIAHCFLCQYDLRNRVSHDIAGCPECPYYQRFGHCNTNQKPYARWGNTMNTEARQKGALAFLAQLRELKEVE